MNSDIYLRLFIVVALIGLSTAAFPRGFLWGSATASYQVEGAWNISRGETIWDVFAHTPGKIADNDNGDVADNHYNLFKDDIALMYQLGLKNYRMSLAWSRLFPTGRPPANPVGFQHYSDVIDELLANGIQPFVTLYHWDLPVGLEGGWLNASIVNDFAVYADAVFSAYGDRVKHWITFNEPLSFTNQGYGLGTNAPGRCSNRSICTDGDTSTEPYIAAHNVLLAHGAAVEIYRNTYQQSQKGIIGITLNCDWAEPYSNSTLDLEASDRHLEFQLAWYADPIFKGDYPQTMKDLVGDRLPTFTDSQKALLNGYVQNNPVADPSAGWNGDQQISVLHERNGTLIGPQAASTWLYVVPWGIRKMLNWIADRYNNPPLYITENGVDVPNENETPLPEVLHDNFRIDYYSQYLSNVSAAIEEDGVDVRGYFAWSFMDNFEWADGYTKRFGLHYVDYANNLARYPKDSAYWFSKFVQANSD